MGGTSDHSNVAERLEPVAVVVHRQLWAGGRKVWTLGVLLALASWPIALVNPTTGLDYSWMSGLYMAVRSGRDFGSEIVFTYGPLGFLAWPELWYGGLAILAFVYSSAVYLAFAVTLTWALERSVGLLAAVVVTFLFLATNPFLEELPLLLAVGWSFAAMRRDRPPGALTLLVVGGGLLCAIEPLIKLSVGPPTAVICLLGLFGARADRRQWGSFVATAVAAFLAFWLLAGQSLGGLWDYASSGAQVIAGYSEAMGFDGGEAWYGVALVVLALGLVAIVGRADFRDGRARWTATALTAVAAYVVFKYGVTQFVSNTVAVAVSALFAIFLMAPWPRQRATRLLAASVVIGAVVVHVYPAGARLDLIQNLTVLRESAEVAIRPNLRQQRIDEARVAMQATFAMTPRVQRAVQGKRVAVEPWETGIVWAYDLEWDPFPAFQSYVAYTSQLDRLNSEALEDPDGPEVLLRPLPAGIVPLGGRSGFAARQALWDPPEQNVVTACHFIPTLTDEHWQVLSRVPDRCGAPKPAGSVEAEPGEAVKVPQAGRGEMVVMRIEGAEVGGFERLWSLFWRPEERYAKLNGGRYSYRLSPGTVNDGMIVSVDRSLDSGVDFVELPVIRTLSVTGADGPLKFDFSRVPIEPAPQRRAADGAPSR